MKPTNLHRIIGAYLTRDANNGQRALTADELARINSKGPLQRAMKVGKIDAEARTVELAFSSEIEAERWFGIEILDHDAASVRMDRMDDGAALLLDHDWRQQIGVIERASIDGDRKGRAVVRFSRSEKAQEVFQDVQDGIRKHVSVGYRVHSATLQEKRDGTDVYRITDWEPYEVSFVAVPLDPTVGVGRAAENPQEEITPAPKETSPVRNANAPVQPTGNTPPMNVKNIRMSDGRLVRCEVDAAGAVVKEIEVLQTAAERSAELAAGGTAERERVTTLQRMAEQYGRAVPNAAELARTAVTEGHSVDQFREALLGAVNARANTPLNEQNEGAALGLTDADVRRYSFLRAIRALANPGDARLQREAAFEFECSRAAATANSREAQGIIVPSEILGRAMQPGDRSRAFNAGTGGGAAGNTGGYGVDTELLTSSFIDILRNRNTIMRLGMVMAGLRGNVDIPRQTAKSQGYWVGEAEDSQEQAPDLGQISLNAKTVAAYTDITRKLMQQTSIGAEMLVRRDLALGLATTIDLAGYYGKGTEKQPRGITNYTGIHAVSFATAAKPTFAEMVEMETLIALDNADVPSMRYVTNAGGRGYAKTAQKFPGTANSATLWEPGNTVNGYGTEVTNQIAAGDWVFGNYGDLLVGLWGGLDITVDTASLSKSGGLRIVTFQDVDFALRRVESFCLGR